MTYIADTITAAMKDQPNGYVGLDGAGVFETTVMPANAFRKFLTARVLADNADVTVGEHFSMVLPGNCVITPINFLLIFDNAAVGAGAMEGDFKLNGVSVLKGPNPTYTITPSAAISATDGSPVPANSQFNATSFTVVPVGATYLTAHINEMSFETSAKGMTVYFEFGLEYI